MSQESHVERKVVMKSMLRVMLSAAFFVGLAVPLAATWTTPAAAFASCSILSGSDSWTGVWGGTNTFVVSVAYDTGVTVAGTLPPATSLPMVLTSSLGHVLTISAGSGGTREYEGDFTVDTDASCDCQNRRCSSFDTVCIEQNLMQCKVIDEWRCVYAFCNGAGGGSCSGGRCTGPGFFKAKF